MKNIIERIVLILMQGMAIVFIFAVTVPAQDPYIKSNTDKTRKSNARVNPTTLAMELSVPLGVLPGRGGNSLPITLNYSSKVWRMTTFATNGTTYGYPSFGEDSISGWTTSLQPIYFESGSIMQIVGSPGGGGGGGGGVANCNWDVRLPRLDCPPWNNTEATTSPTSVEYPINLLRRMIVHMPDGSTHDFVPRLTAEYIPANQPWPVYNTWFSTDESNLRLEFVTASGKPTLFVPDGSRYEFYTLVQGGQSSYVMDYFDRNGSKTTCQFTDVRLGNWRDSMGRTVSAPHAPYANGNPSNPIEGTNEYFVPTMVGHQMRYTFHWTKLENTFAQTQYQKKYFRDLFDEVGIWEPEGQQFNPVVLSRIDQPDGRTLQFLYNEYGEIERIVYPTGTQEEFLYGKVSPFSFLTGPQNGNYFYRQANRGVVQRTVKPDSDPTHAMVWQYGVPQQANLQPFAPYRVTETAPDGTFTERYLFVAPQGNPVPPVLPSQLGGRVYEERVYDSPSKAQMLHRKLTEYNLISSSASGGGVIVVGGGNGGCISSCLSGAEGGVPDDALSTPAVNGSPAPRLVAFPRVTRTTTFTFETDSDKAFAQSTTYGYDNYSNVIRQTGYDYAILDATQAQSAALSGTPLGTPLKTTATTYVTDTNYINKQMVSMPKEVVVRDGDQNGAIIAKSETVYDNLNATSATTYPWSSPVEVQSGVGTSYNCGVTGATCWQDPNTAYLGNVTTTRVLNLDTNTWIESHVQYDQFGNAVKARDPVGNETTTAFAALYKYAYPTSVTTPAPDPSGVHGTTETSTVSTTYDFNTGLPLTVTDDFGQTVQTEYNDPLLRPTRTFGVNFTAPETQTIYGDTPGNLFVKVRKQLDPVNWDEATTFMDGLGRTVKTQAKDSQGDVFVETHYDNMGRVDRVTNPYRAGDTIYWSKTRYDELGRAVESYAPATIADINANTNLVSLGVTSFGISTVTNYVGTVVTTTDASLRKGRSITNALGQLVRVDEPTGISTNADSDLGSISAPLQPSFYKYNAQGKMVEVTQGVQKRWFKYDSLGRLIRVRQPEQEVNAALNLADEYNTSGQWTAAFSYDVLGNVLTATDAKGTVITNAYDRASRVTSRTYNDSTPPVNFYYDGKGLAQTQSPNYAKGKLTKVFSTVSETKNTVFDNFGRLKETQQITDGNTYTSKYTYNLSGALIEEEYPSGRKVKNEFESDGDLMRVFGKANANATEKTYANAFSYIASGGISQMRLGNGKWETAKFNDRLQVTDLGLGASANDAGTWKVNYEYGELQTDGTTVDTAKNTGNIAKQTLTVPGTNFIQAYRYDSLYRLTEAKETPLGSSTNNWIQNWDYDRYGNRLSFTQNIAGNTAVTNPAIDTNTNRFVTSGTNFQYDLNGNLTRDSESRQFTFNGDNKQTVVRDAASNIIGQYFYDGNGARVKKVTNTETTIFVYSSGKLVAEYSTQLSQNPTTSYTTTDHLGSPRVITDQFGQVKSRRDFLPFGEDIYTGVGNRTAALKYGSIQDDIRQKFTGYQKDSETNLDFAEARMYENRHGRFTAVDPLANSMNPTKPQSYNRFVYCMNSPFKYIDKNGEYPTEIHNLFIKEAFPGLSESEIKMIQWGSASVDTSLGTGSWIQLGRNGNVPSFTLTLDFPRTMLPSEAHKHAMIPSGKTKEEAIKMADSFIEQNINSAIEKQLTYDALGGNLSYAALYDFGKASHTMMDAFSPAHRFFQAYSGPKPVGLGLGKYSIGLFLWGKAQIDHKNQESVYTAEDKAGAIQLMRINLLTGLGKTAFEKAVTDPEERQKIYDIVSASGYQYQTSVPTSFSISPDTSLPIDTYEYLRKLPFRPSSQRQF